jgi:hypothetical protein
MAWNWDVRIQHTYMEANVCADFMAKLATSDDQGFIVWDVPIKGIASFLLAGQLRTYFHTVVKFFLFSLLYQKKLHYIMTMHI